MDQLTQIRSLILLHLEGRLTASDQLVLDRWIDAHPDNRKLFEELTSSKTLQKQLDRLHEIDVEAALERFKISEYASGSAGSPVRRMRFLPWWGWAAASMILVLGIGSYIRSLNKKNTHPPGAAVTHPGVAPGKNGAVLTLADGSQIVLDDLDNGVIASQNGARVVLRNGRLAYDLTGTVTGEVAYNTMSTPKGRQFQIILPDGTKIWLNAASSVRYPLAFTGKERRVEVSGEAYFEVAKDPEMPFRVNINGRAEVKVLGTSFNVNAYDNERGITATLLEGSIAVAVSTDHPDRQLQTGQPGQPVQPGEKEHSVILKPGQQAQIAHVPGGQGIQPEIRTIDDADTERTIAWKNGLFNFNGVPLKDAMRQLERWYNIEVVYEEQVPDIKFWGEMSRGVTLDGLIAALRRSEVHFTIEGKKLIVGK